MSYWLVAFSTENWIWKFVIFWKFQETRIKKKKKKTYIFIVTSKRWNRYLLCFWNVHFLNPFKNPFLFNDFNEWIKIQREIELILPWKIQFIRRNANIERSFLSIPNETDISFNPNPHTTLRVLHVRPGERINHFIARVKLRIHFSSLREVKRNSSETTVGKMMYF